MKQTLDLTGFKLKPATRLPQFGGTAASGASLGVTSQYLTRDERPWFGISGEFHYSRYSAAHWRDELIKMKMGGINVISTYVIWNHHEAVHGQFDWRGDRDLRRFLQLCQQLQLAVILRIGPFAHGEVRNGGLPDWLYPMAVRSNDPTYLHAVAAYFDQIGQQVSGLLFQDDGPVIAVQLENEYQHAGAPWEFTRGTTDEWVPAGNGGVAHIQTLKKLAQAAGLTVPLYTGTAWGNAVAPLTEVLPLWGGYAYWPWLFRDATKKAHPLTREYLYRDYHQPSADFQPAYDPAQVPFACCEMGGGMSVFYHYRFVLDPDSVAAMSNVKVASGCNFVGYYVFHGGTNPIGKTYMNENQTPKRSYDYQAPLGEFGQVRQAYHQLRRLHYFYQDCTELLAPMATVLPATAPQPEDHEPLRWAVRTDGTQAFVFLNNYQDHTENLAKHDQRLCLKLPTNTVSLPAVGGFSLASGANAILPVNLLMGGVRLRYALAQLLACTGRHYVFFTPAGMTPEFAFDTATIRGCTVTAGKVQACDDLTLVRPAVDRAVTLTITPQADLSAVTITCLTTAESLNYWQFEQNGERQMCLCDAPLLADQGRLWCETTASQVQVQGLRHTHLSPMHSVSKPIQVSVQSKQVTSGRYLLTIAAPTITTEIAEVLLRISYTGDVGYLFAGDTMISDNFNNGAVWEIGLADRLANRSTLQLTLVITPVTKHTNIVSDTPMAGVSDHSDKAPVKLDGVSAVVVRRVAIESMR